MEPLYAPAKLILQRSSKELKESLLKESPKISERKEFLRLLQDLSAKNRRSQNGSKAFEYVRRAVYDLKIRHIKNGKGTNFCVNLGDREIAG